MISFESCKPGPIKVCFDFLSRLLAVMAVFDEDLTLHPIGAEIESEVLKEESL